MIIESNIHLIENFIPFFWSHQTISLVFLLFNRTFPLFPPFLSPRLPLGARNYTEKNLPQSCRKKLWRKNSEPTCDIVRLSFNFRGVAVCSKFPSKFYNSWGRPFGPCNQCESRWNNRKVSAGNYPNRENYVQGRNLQGVGKRASLLQIELYWRDNAGIIRKFDKFR